MPVQWLRVIQQDCLGYDACCVLSCLSSCIVAIRMSSSPSDRNGERSAASERGLLASAASRWLSYELLPAAGIILLVWPFVFFMGEYGLKEFFVAGANVLAAGDLAAIGFCFLLPLAFN